MRVNAVVVQGQITIPNPSFEENTEVTNFDYKLPNGWQGSGGGTVVVNSPPSAPNGPWGAGSAVAQGAPDGDYFMSIRAQLGLPVPRVAVAWLLTDRGRW